MKFCVFVVFLFLSTHSKAYVLMIKNGYVSCTACHVNPNGGGNLTQYGKGIGSSMSLFPDKEQDLSLMQRTIGFNGRMDHNFQIRPSRLSGPTRDTKIFAMQADYLNAFKVTSKVTSNVILSRVPYSNPRSGEIENRVFDNILVRRFTVAYRPDKNYEFAAGRDLVNLGLGINDHTAFIKSRNRLGVYDVQNLVRFNYFGKETLVNVSGFIPSNQELEGNKEVGIATTAEQLLPVKFLTIGGNLLSAESESIQRNLYGVFSKYGYQKFVLMAEYDFTKRKVKAADTKFNQDAYFLSLSFYPIEALELTAKRELLKTYDPFTQEVSRNGLFANLKINKYFALQSLYQKDFRKGSLDDELFMQQIFINYW